METIYLAIVLILFLFAISDLIVGVSNDAVNFLNSAIGSKVASFRTIMIIASLGVLFGAVFSSGMMEVARKGIFNPSMFYFDEIMIIFLAVMITDVLLLDGFNTIGMPTSTTVSIVFELLGAAVGMATIKLVFGSPESLLPIKQYLVDNNMLKDLGSSLNVASFINTSKALAIISGIFLSVLVAFTAGAIVQYLARIVFTFNYKVRVKYFGAIWGGIAFTIITYFIFIKGAKSATFMTHDVKDWFVANTVLILLVSFVGWTVLLQLMNAMFKTNILRLVVLVGTFSLAMAFAGNDLVNFIGVPLAGWASFKEWMTNPSVSPDNLLMTALSGKVQTPIYFLLFAGLIMVVTLFVSKKAKSVVKTSIDLSRQDDGDERFPPTAASRAIVRAVMSISKGVSYIVPKPILNGINKQFNPVAEDKQDKDALAAFDLIRASVNLVVASVLIAFGTSLKLPLSTTYVTFMVAMGTSFGDKAWGRESAVYRVSGVISVVGGWFLTALTAFTVAFVFVSILKFGGFVAVIAFILLTVFIVYRTHSIHKKNEARKLTEGNVIEDISDDTIIERSASTISDNIGIVDSQLKKLIKALEKEDLKALKKLKKEIGAVSSRTKYLKDNVGSIIEKLRDDNENDFNFVQVLDYLREMLHSATYMVKPALDHVSNNHKPLHDFQIKELMDVWTKYDALSKLVKISIESPSKANEDKILEIQSEILGSLKEINKSQLKRLKSAEVGTKNSILYLKLLDEWRGMTLHIVNLYKSYRDFVDYQSK
ncbi:MAG: inorganic phosphate transporter [Chlorobi bacterium]|nr:inorganic phosphate transporter [Chlorobiota bacterium]